jgi:transcriptional regulator with GAF, ATPase, and Fis domain
MARVVGEPVRSLVMRITRAESWPKEGSPVQVTVSEQRFDEIHLLSNYPHEANEAYEKWLGAKVQFHSLHIENPWDYEQIFHHTDKALRTIRASSPQAELCLHLTSGTTAMSSILLLLGTTTFSPAEFYQSFHRPIHGRAISKVSLPFDLELFIREQFINPDQSWSLSGLRPPAQVRGFESIVGESQAIRVAVERARRAAMRSVNVLLLGESGVGKELFAQAIHRASGRPGKFVAVNCGAIPSDLFESELFGAVKGAASGITNNRTGYFVEADKGTLFLDEIGTLAPHQQAKLLRVIGTADKSQGPTLLQVDPLGASGKGRPVDVRIVSATNRDLETSDDTGAFRNDLFHRLNTFPIRIPSLRERKSDVPLIAAHLIESINKDAVRTEPNYKSRALSTGALRRLGQYDWRGNVRELHAVLSRALIMSATAEVTRQEVDEEILQIERKPRSDVFSRTREAGFAMSKRLEQIERAFIEDALEETGRVQKKAADLLGLQYTTLNQRIKRLGITP